MPAVTLITMILQAASHRLLLPIDLVILYAKQKHLGCKKCKANQKQHASRQVRPKALISAEAKKLATLSKNF